MQARAQLGPAYAAALGIAAATLEAAQAGAFGQVRDALLKENQLEWLLCLSCDEKYYLQDPLVTSQYSFSGMCDS